MAQRKGDYIHTTIHDFKTNFSHYVRMIEQHRAQAIIVKRYNKEVGLFIPYKKQQSEKAD